MKNIQFDWDPAKADSNRTKHGVSFDEAKTVFSDENAILIDDPDHSIHEDRFILMGLSSSLKLLVVCHCVRNEDEIIRIISARKATNNEANYYGKA